MTALPSIQLSKVLIAFCRGADIVVDRDTFLIEGAEVSDQAASTAENIEPHELRVVLMLTESLEDPLHILRRCISDCFQILLVDVRSSEPKNAVDDRIINGCSGSSVRTGS